MGKRPTTFILRKGNPNGSWGEYDFALAEAAQILDSEFCPSCKQPIWLCHSETDEIQFKVRDEHCYALERIERAQEANSKKKGYNGAGVNLVARPWSTAGRPLSDYREMYYRELVARHESDQPES